MTPRPAAVRPSPTLAVIKAAGDARICAPRLLTGLSVVACRTVIEQVCSFESTGPVVLDLSRVAAISRPGALMLFECTRSAERAGKRVVLHRTPEIVTERLVELSLTAAFRTIEESIPVAASARRSP